MSLTKNHVNAREMFVGVIERFGWKNGWENRQLPIFMMSYVCRKATGEVLMENIWFNQTLGFLKLGLAIGDLVEFEARFTAQNKKNFRIKANRKDQSFEWHYKLRHPTKLKKIAP